MCPSDTNIPSFFRYFFLSLFLFCCTYDVLAIVLCYLVISSLAQLVGCGTKVLLYKNYAFTIAFFFIKVALEF